MEPLHIVPAAPDDYEWSARLMATSEPWITLCRDLASCRETLSRPGTVLFVARNQNTAQPLGFILLAPYGFAASPYIASIAVAPDVQGRSVGAQLMAFAEQRFHNRGHLFLLVSSFNARAQQFYHRRGYKLIAELEDYIIPGHSEFIFHRRLP